MEDLAIKAAELLNKVREQKPLVHNITNVVVTNICANALLQIGALPVMSHAREEVEEMVGAAGALALNIGTLTPALVEAMILAGQRANKLGVPVVFDPVGAGATRLRTDSSQRILKEVKVEILRGNSAEISILAGSGGEIKGVEAVGTQVDPAVVVRELAAKNKQVVAVTGKRDFISDGQRTVAVDNGHQMMSSITGTGCMSTAVIGAFAAVEPDYLLATAAALVCYGLAGEKAAAISSGPGSFQVAFFDSLYSLQPEDVAAGCKALFI